MRKLFTSESVTEGHPDKLCDQVSDAVLDALLAQDPMSRVACETCATTGMVMVMGEITTTAKVDIPAIVRDVVLDIGYNDSSLCFDGNTCAVLTSIHAQSPDIAMGVDDALETRTQDANEIGAGDQGMMFGFACDETPEYMPTAIAFAHRLTRRLTEVRKNGTLPWLRPDGKAQVTIAYEDGQPVAVDTIVISTQHTDGSLPMLMHPLVENVITPVLQEARQHLPWLDIDTYDLYINPTGRFVQGGPAADTGLTGRKIIVDTYGGYAPHGGGAFSGKDPTKVDRSAAYMARHIAKNVVASGLCDKCQVQLAYAIGMALPVSLRIDTFGANVDEEKLCNAVDCCFELTPLGIIDALNLRLPIYEQTSAYGHFGNVAGGNFTWESTHKAGLLRRTYNTL